MFIGDAKSTYMEFEKLDCLPGLWENRLNPGSGWWITVAGSFPVVFRHPGLGWNCNGQVVETGNVVRPTGVNGQAGIPILPGCLTGKSAWVSRLRRWNAAATLFSVHRLLKVNMKGLIEAGCFIILGLTGIFEREIVTFGEPVRSPRRNPAQGALPGGIFQSGVHPHQVGCPLANPVVGCNIYWRN